MKAEACKRISAEKAIKANGWEEQKVKDMASWSDAKWALMRKALEAATELAQTAEMVEALKDKDFGSGNVSSQARLHCDIRTKMEVKIIFTRRGSEEL